MQASAEFTIVISVYLLFFSLFYSQHLHCCFSVDSSYIIREEQGQAKNSTGIQGMVINMDIEVCGEAEDIHLCYQSYKDLRSVHCMAGQDLLEHITEWETVYARACELSLIHI